MIINILDVSTCHLMVFLPLKVIIFINISQFFSLLFFLFLSNFHPAFYRVVPGVF